MTESGNTPNHWKNNDLGGHQYTDEEATIIHAIAMLLKGRDKMLANASSIVGGTAPRPRDYIQLYTKTAGFIYELAKNLAAFPLPPGIPQKSIAEWVDLVTGRLSERGHGASAAPEDAALKHIRVSLLLDGKEVAHSGPGLAIENIDPEAAKRILISICNQFPGLVSDEETDCGAAVMELSILLKVALEKT